MYKNNILRNMKSSCYFCFEMTQDQLTTADDLRSALDTLQAKWGRFGARFLKDVTYNRSDITGLFVFDGVVYEVTITQHKELHLFELDGDDRRAVSLPPGLAFPKGFVRAEGYK